MAVCVCAGSRIEQHDHYAWFGWRRDEFFAISGGRAVPANVGLRKQALRCR
jgi:hypothetical protein